MASGPTKLFAAAAVVAAAFAVTAFVARDRLMPARKRTAPPVLVAGSGVPAPRAAADHDAKTALSTTAPPIAAAAAPSTAAPAASQPDPLEDLKGLTCSPIPVEPEPAANAPEPEVAGLTGRVVDAKTRAPIARFHAFAVSEKASGTDEELRARLERTFEAPDGAFTVRGLVPGRFRVLVRADGYRPAVRGGIDVAKGKITPGVVVSLEAESGARAKPASISKAGVRGSVVDASTGSPIAGAVVQVTVARSLEGSARTEGDGTFFVPVAKAGKARAIATHEEYLDAESAAFSAESGASAVAPTIALRPGGAVEGVAVGADGEPMPGGFVQAELAEGERDDADRPRGKTAQADASGRFRIAGLESGTWTVVMREGVDVRAAAAAVVVEGSTTKVVLRKPPPGRDLRGRVTRAGEPVAHAEVHADSPDAPVFTRRHLSTWTAGDGMFAIERVPDGSGFVRVAAGGVTWRRPIEVGGERDLYLGIELPSGTVGGTVWTSDGSEASGVRVLVRPATAGAASSRTWAEATTDASGRYAISGLAAGHYRVIAGAAGSAIAYAAQAKTTDVADGRPAQADFTLDAGERVVVEVVDARGEPLRKATVKLVPERSGDADEEALPSATTDVDGRARILNAGVGTWVARAFVKGKAVGESARFRVDRGREPRVRIDVK